MQGGVLSAAVAASLFLSGCSDRYGIAADNASLAQAQFAAGNLIEARESIQRAIIERDDVAEYFILLAQIEMASGQAAGAFNAYSRALDLQADNISILQNIAELGLQTGRIEEADEAADRMLLLAPGLARALLVKGFIAIEQKRYNDARRFSSEILEGNPNDQGGIILAARLNALEGRFDDAVALVENALSGSQNESEALNATLLEVYRAQGNVEGMKVTFPKVVSAAGQIAEYQLDYVNFLYKVGERGAARKQAVTMVSARPNDTVMLAALVRLLLEYDSSPLTEGQLESLARTGTRAAQLAFARFYLETRQLDQAMTVIARPLGEGVAEAQGLAARILLAQGRGREAGKLADQVLTADPRQPDALLTRSALRLASGQTDAAIEDANVVVSDAPQEYAGYVALAKAQLATGSRLRARQVFERGINTLPQSALLAAAYEEFLRSEGDGARVLSLRADLAAASPSSLRAVRAYIAACGEFGTATCRNRGERAFALAARSFVIDQPPGTPRPKGMFARMTPEQVCNATGGVCTVS